MDNLIKHASHESNLLLIFIVALIVLLICIPYFVGQHRRYGAFFVFATLTRKFIAGIAALVTVALLIYGVTPYITPPTDEVAIIIGNTQNTPRPSIDSELSEVIENTMLRHKGDNVSDLVNSIRIISAIKNPEVIKIDVSDLKFKRISNNDSNARRDASANVRIFQEKINSLLPTENGANYLEAILEARDNVKTGSRIIVIGSGLSDSGDLNFSKYNLLRNEQTRAGAINKITEKYGRNYLAGFSVEFYGLGDTTTPQEPLPIKHKEVLRNLYRDVVRSLGGDVDVYTKTLVGKSVETSYVVGTTDTGCGNVGLVFDDSNLKFVPNQATFTDETLAKNSLITVKDIWDRDADTIQSIQVDGYIARYVGVETLSQPRANLVKDALVDLGIPADKIHSTGRGVGPYPQDEQNRIVKVTISRDSDECKI